MNSPLSPGTKLGHYEVLGQIGAGGMGEVYLAQDTKLDRKVALKILPADLAANADRMRRFVQEAKATAALNHPNIAHIYEIGSAPIEREGSSIGTDTNFIALEFIDGVTLREKIHRERQLPKLLRYLQHVAEGLAKAHAAGIVHRDLKPDNIMITRDEHAKILDFGLAKLVEQHAAGIAESGSSEVATAVMPQRSTPGTIMGTVGYMSPEQAQGKTDEIDSRSDIFSFGCILFEAATGHKPFEGDSVIKSLHKIVYEPAPSLSDFNPSAPSDLHRIVRRCLAKDPEERYQTIKDVAIELKQLRRDIYQSTDLDTTVPPSPRGTIRMGYMNATQSATRSSAPTSSSNSAQVMSGVRSYKTIALAALVLLVIAAVAVVYIIKYRGASTRSRVAHFQNMKITRVTNEGNVETAAMSPDGKYIAYSLEESGKRSLWTKHLGTGSRVQIVPATDAYAMNASTFSSDGYVYYTKNDEENPLGAVYQIPVLGGTPRKILSKVSQPISISPDGKQIAFGRYHLNGTEDELFIANIDGSNERRLITVSEPNWLGGSSPAWSPDGHTIAVGYGSETKNEVTGLKLGMTAVVISVADGTMKLSAAPHWLYVGNVAWFNDGSGLVLPAQEQQIGALQIWQISYPQGDVQRITNDLNSYAFYSLTLTADDSGLLAVQSDPISNIWVATVGQPGSERPLTVRKNSLEGSRSIAWTVDGRVIFDSNIDGKANIWIVSAAGGDPKPVTDSNLENSGPETSADGRHIIFGSLRNGGNQIWRMDLNGSDQKQLTQETGGVPTYSVSHDGHWVIYDSFMGGIHKVSLNGGGLPQVVIAKGSFHYPQVSPDGKLLAYFFDDEQTQRPKIGIIKFDDGALVKIIDLPLSAAPGSSSSVDLFYRGWHWSPDGRALVYIKTLGGVSNLWSQPIDGGAAKQITNFKSDRILTFAYSWDGRQLALARGSRTSDAVLISALK
jgi:serine/threonine protein kinase